jgi:hypothetical protein
MTPGRVHWYRRHLSTANRFAVVARTWALQASRHIALLYSRLLAATRLP